MGYKKITMSKVIYKELAYDNKKLTETHLNIPS